jgi:starch phosphorylase
MDRYVPLPPLPPRISRLNDLAYDLSWSWHPDAREVFRDLDYPLWRFTDHNPVLLLHLVEPDRLAHAASDPEFLALYDAAIAGLDEVRAGAGTWWTVRAPAVPGVVALITPRVALHQSLPIETDAAGVIAAECFKEASDLGIPLVGITLMYPRGYAHQRLSAEGWQQDAYEYIDWSDAPIRPALRADGQRCDLTIPIGTADVKVGVWQVRAGRVTLYLLDTDVDGNAAWDRELASGWFLDDAEVRARQAVLLGAGAVAALEALAIQPAVWHLSEGLATFVSLERINRMMARGTTFEAALEEIRGSTVYSTRDPEAIRRDAFSFATLDRHLGSVWAGLAGSREPLLRLGHFETGRGAAFHPSVFGVATSGVAVLPAASAGGERVAVPDPTPAAPAMPLRTVPEGIHLPSWVSSDLAAVFADAVGPDWRELQDDPVAWLALLRVPDDALWMVRERLRGYLIEFMRIRARRCWSRERASGTRLVALGTLLDASALTIGYAQPFGEGRGPELLFTDPVRLAQILTAARRPVQFIFAGRAHPADDAGKHHLQRLFRHALDPAFGGRVAFLEDYDLHVARLLVQGCDVWLGTPRRGAPALIGGIQAAINGAPHLGTRDAWWRDGWTGHNGWIIDAAAGGEPAVREAAEARAIYQLLENRIVPAFYDRERGGVPQRWLSMVKAAIVSAVPRFCARRMMKAFADGLYRHPAVERAVDAAGLTGATRNQDV